MLFVVRQTALQPSSLSNSFPLVLLTLNYDIIFLLSLFAMCRVMGGAAVAMPFVVVPIRDMLGLKTNQFTKRSRKPIDTGGH